MGDFNVVVIGAGMSGLVSAKYLVESGEKDVIILEARDRIGGRVCSAEIGGGIVDLGAAWIHGTEGNPIYDLSRKVCAKLVSIASGNFWINPLCRDERFELRDFEGEPLNTNTFNEYNEMSSSFFRSLESELNQSNDREQVWSTVKSLLENKYSELNEAQTAAIKWNLRGIESWNSASLDCVLEYDESESGDCPGDHCLLEEGMFSIFSAVLDDSIQVQYGKVVNHISVDIIDGMPLCCIRTLSGEEFKAKRIVITVPLGVLKAGSITFVPPLPTPKQNAIDLLAMGKSRKIFLQFDQCFWPREKFILAGLSACDNLTWVWENYYAIRGIPVVGTDVWGQVADNMEDLSHEELLSMATQAFKQTLYGTKADEIEMPTPTDIITSSWNSDPFSLGAYSHTPRGGNILHILDLAAPIAFTFTRDETRTIDEIEFLQLLESNALVRAHNIRFVSDQEYDSPVPMMFFAGEATNPEFQGSLHAALVSGQIAAHQLLQSLSLTDTKQQ